MRMRTWKRASYISFMKGWWESGCHKSVGLNGMVHHAELCPIVRTIWRPNRYYPAPFTLTQLPDITATRSLEQLSA